MSTKKKPVKKVSKKIVAKPAKKAPKRRNVIEEFDDPEIASVIVPQNIEELQVALESAVVVKRYSVRLGTRFFEDPKGEWVRFSDLV